MALNQGFNDRTVKLKLPAAHARALSALMKRALETETDRSIKRDCGDLLVELDREISSCI